MKAQPDLGWATYQVAARPRGGRHDPAVDTGNWDGFGLVAGGKRGTLAAFMKTKHENSGCAYHGDAS